MRILKTITVACAICWLSQATFADQAPVIDLNSTQASANPPSSIAAQARSIDIQGQTASLSTNERLARLEQQMANLNTMNMPQQIADLQEKMQQLNGMLQVQAHDLKLLNQQQRSFYKDLDDRINQLNNLSTPNTTITPSKPNATPKATLPSKSASSRKSVSQHSDAGAYQAAFTLLRQKQYEKAKQGMLLYISSYPQGQFIAKAHYWLGEIYMHDGQNEKAQGAFNVVINDFPNSDKASDALLKLGVLDQKAGLRNQAVAKFKKIKTSFPGSTAAQLASIYLQQLGA